MYEKGVSEGKGLRRSSSSFSLFSFVKVVVKDWEIVKKDAQDGDGLKEGENSRCK
jgi:hypothetical protein